MSWYRKASKMFSYFMQCDLFRRQGPKQEQQWKEMMKNAVKISLDEFLKYCDVSPFTEEYTGITERDAMLAEIRQDPAAYFARSTIDGRTVYFMGHSGFEFIFTNK